MAVPINIGAAARPPRRFTLARNAWYCLDVPDRSRPKLPIPETEGSTESIPGFGTPSAVTCGFDPTAR